MCKLGDGTAKYQNMIAEEEPNLCGGGPSLGGHGDIPAAGQGPRPRVLMAQETSVRVALQDQILIRASRGFSLAT